MLLFIVFYVHQGCIYLAKKTEKNKSLQVQPTVFYFILF